MIDEKNKKRIRLYCILPKIAIISFIMSFVTLIVMLILATIEGVVFEGVAPFNVKTISVPIIIVFIYVIIGVCSFMYSIIGTNNKKWKEMVKNISAEQKDFNDISGPFATSLGANVTGNLMGNSKNELVKGIGKATEVVGVLGMVGSHTHLISQNAKSVAKVCDIEIPKAKKYIIPLIFIPIIIIIATYIPTYIEASNMMKERNSMVSEIIYKIQDTFSKKCESVSIDDPNEKYQDYGYYVSAALYEDDYDIDSHSRISYPYIYITIENDGKIGSISYRGEIDKNQTKQENIERIEKDFAVLHKLLIEANIQLPDNMKNNYTFSQGFKQQYINENNDTEIVLRENRVSYFYYPASGLNNESSISIFINNEE